MARTGDPARRPRPASIASDPKLAALLDEPAASGRAALDGRRTRLSAREVELVRMLADGASRAEIGRAMYLSETMVKQMLRYAYTISGTNTQASLVAWAFRRGLID